MICTLLDVLYSVHKVCTDKKVDGKNLWKLTILNGTWTFMDDIYHLYIKKIGLKEFNGV